MIVRESVLLGGRPLTFETGRLAKQAAAAVLVTYGETQVLVTVCFQDPRPGLDFFPLTCDFIEKTYAAGRIPGGFFKREARQREEEILTCRVIDRPIRPLFPKGFKMETQVIATVMSSDKENKADVLALTGASACLHLSALPWEGPIAGVRVGRVNGELIINPTVTQLTTSDLDITVAASRDAIVMVEGGGDQISERDMIDALEFAHAELQPVLDLIDEIRAVVGKPKMPFVAPDLEPALKQRVAALVDADLRAASHVREKHARYDGYKVLKQNLSETLKKELGEDKYLEVEKLVGAEFEHRKSAVVRGYVLDERTRIDGRDLRTVRPIATDVGVLFRTHGSALFQRGETQAIATTTLGTSSDEQKIDGLIGQSWKRFYLHYNFPPFSTGETKGLRGPARREIGHGALAERAIEQIIPDKEQFPYTIRVVSETLESNGSSSMAAVCGGCMSLMDAGVPIKAPVAGIAMGLISEGSGRYAVLSDILGDEDHLGDMDFKVCGTERGITAIQMDIKVKGLTRAILGEALEQAREGRLHILGKMLETLPAPRPELNKHAPRIVSLKVKPEQIRIIIGPGGKTIKGIVDQTGVVIDVEDDGTVNVASSDAEQLRRAIEIIEGLTAEPEVGRIYDGVVRRVADFGAFVEILPNWDGLVHISELAYGRTERVEDVCREGDKLRVKVLSVDSDGKVRLSHKDTLPPPEGYTAEVGEGGEPRPPRPHGDGGRPGGGGRMSSQSRRTGGPGGGGHGGPRGDGPPRRRR
ncbi:MAG: polyribonucleotide nucleotidyltransferase [Polyangiaceae bacterium]|nr:polyribonucleotide nucleotidyltransferase [Polyangiaceae bacterium]